MCRPYVRHRDKQKVAEWFHAGPNSADLPMLEADYNIASTTHQPIIRAEQGNERPVADPGSLGLIPFFTKDLKHVTGLTTINARSETITTASRAELRPLAQ